MKLSKKAIASRIRRAAVKYDLVASSRTQTDGYGCRCRRWWFADIYSNVLDSPEEGLIDEEAFEYLTAPSGHSVDVNTEKQDYKQALITEIIASLDITRPTTKINLYLDEIEYFHAVPKETSIPLLLIEDTLKSALQYNQEIYTKLAEALEKIEHVIELNNLEVKFDQIQEKLNINISHYLSNKVDAVGKGLEQFVEDYVSPA